MEGIAAMDAFGIRAIEVHSAYAWDFRWIMKVLAFAEARGLNALVLHRNDVVEQVVYPGACFGAGNSCANIYERYREAFRKIYRYTPTRRSGPLLRRGYLNRVAEEAGRRGIGLFLQNKELSFPDVLLELYPDLVKDGHGCPSEPFWFEFIAAKYKELFEDVPGIAGIITSVGTGESRISITANRCTCDLCRAATPETWYRKVIDAMHGAITSRGRRLVLRDFAFTKKAHGELASAFEGLPPDIGVALKDTPHDFYPTFPQNELIRKIRDREKWIEYDAMAQYFGWGIGPATMIGYMKERMAEARKLGASGIVLRTDWESLDGHTAFDTPNVLNLYAGAAFGKDPASDEASVYRTWLEDEKAFAGDASERDKAEAVSWIASIFDRNWDAVRRALYVGDCVFNDCSTFPVGCGQAIWLAEEKNSLKDWVPEKKDALLPTEENTLRILAEKDEALGMVRELRRMVGDPPSGLSEAFAAGLAGRYEVFELYVEGFRSLARLFALLRYAEASGSVRASLAGRRVADEFRSALGEADRTISAYGEFYRSTSLPSAVYQLLNAERLASFRDDAARSFEEISRGERA